MKRKIRIPAINFDLNINGNPLHVIAQPYLAADNKKRFRVSYNGSPIHIFGVDAAARKIKVLDSASEEIPPQIEYAIASTLMHSIAA